MRALTKSIHRLIRDSKAATAIEYGLICALIVIACMGAIGLVATHTINMWNDVSNSVDNVM